MPEAGFRFSKGRSLAVAVGDTFTAPLTVSPAGYTLQVNNDGTIEVFSGGNTSRQSFTYTRHILASNTTDGPATCWVNEVPPAWSRGVYVSTLVVGIPIAPINLTAYCSSASGDTLDSRWHLASAERIDIECGGDFRNANGCGHVQFHVECD